MPASYAILALLGPVSTTQLLVILLVALLLFGKRLPDVARSLGRSLNEFKKGLKETQDDLEKSIKSDQDSPDDKQPE